MCLLYGNISDFLDFHLQPLVQPEKSHILEINNFLNKLPSLQKLPSSIISYGRCLRSVPKHSTLFPFDYLHLGSDQIIEWKKMSRVILCDLTENVFRNNTSKFGKTTLKQQGKTAVGRKFAPPYSILFMAELEEEIL